MMSNFAVLSGNIVSNIIVANSLADAEIVTGVGSCVEYSEENPTGIGWTYDFETQVFFPPVPSILDSSVPQP